MAFLVFVILAGIFAIGSGLWTLRKRRELDRDGVSTVGRVYRLDHDRDANSTSYTPVIAYTDERGAERKFRSRLSSTDVRHPVGSDVPLRYLRSRPEEVEIDTRHYRIWSVLLPIGGGVVFIAAAIAVLASGRV